ncbi:MAG TPA: hypothetical protein VIG66_06640 [Noviherbaspirillum sp.]
MYLPIRLAALLLPLSLSLPAQAQTPDFSGAWVAAVCPSGAKSNAAACANFVLELRQRDGQVCGAHMYASADYAQMEEGAAPSLNVMLAPGSAADALVRGAGIVVTNVSGQPQRLNIELALENGALSWKRLDTPPGKVLLPRTARFSKAGSRTLFAPLFEQELRAACDHVFDLAAAQKAAPIPGSEARAVPPVPAPR